MIEKAMNVRLAEENKNEEIEKKSNESVAKQEFMSDEQFYEAYNSMLRVVAGEDGTEHNMVDITEIADEMERRGITNEQLHHDIAKYREAKKKSGKAAEIAQEKENKTVIQQESMSDEQFYEAYNSMLRVVAGEDGTEHNMVDVTEIADEMERRGISNGQLQHDVEKYREEVKKKSDKTVEIAQLSDAELIKRINDFREALQKGNYVTVTNPEEIKLIQDEARNRGLIGKEKNHGKNVEPQNSQSFKQDKGKINITNIVRTGLQSLQIGNEEVEQASNNLSKDTQEKDIGER